MSYNCGYEAQLVETKLAALYVAICVSRPPDSPAFLFSATRRRSGTESCRSRYALAAASSSRKTTTAVAFEYIRYAMLEGLTVTATIFPSPSCAVPDSGSSRNFATSCSNLTPLSPGMSWHAADRWQARRTASRIVGAISGYQGESPPIGKAASSTKARSRLGCLTANVWL